MELKQGVRLQGGKYTIKRMLGQGGFGITYLGVQTGLGRQVAIKEFFMKDHCNRDASTSCVSVGSSGACKMVDMYHQKFLKEARTLAEMDNRHVVRVYDVFEENATAYYVMEHISGGSLKDLVGRRGSLPEAEALGYIRQLADALAYIHGRHVMHLDVKPGNIMLRPDGEVVLIDFGIAKHYDADNHETSGTPVGKSAGYAPMEQYQEGGVREFSPATDIYSMGATLYFLFTAAAPPEAHVVYENGLPPLPRFVSPAVCRAIEQAMQPSRKKRLQSVPEFLALLPESEEEQKKKKEEADRQAARLREEERRKAEQRKKEEQREAQRREEERRKAEKRKKEAQQRKEQPVRHDEPSRGQKADGKSTVADGTVLDKKPLFFFGLFVLEALGIWLGSSAYAHPSFPHGFYAVAMSLLAAAGIVISLLMIKSRKRKVISTVVQALLLLVFAWSFPVNVEYTELVPGQGFRYASLLGEKGEVREADMVAVRKFGNWQMVDSYGRVLIPSDKLDYDDVTSWVSSYDKYIVVRKDGKAGFIDRNGNVVVAPGKYDMLFEIRDCNLIEASVRSGKDERGKIISKCGILDANGKEIWPVVYDKVGYSCSEGYIVVKDEKGYGFVDTLGVKSIPCQFVYASDFEQIDGRKVAKVKRTVYEKGSLVSKIKECFIDEEGKEVEGLPSNF